MLKTRLMKQVHILILLGALLITACGSSVPEATVTPTLRVDEIQTFAVATFSSALTKTALAAPSPTPMATVTPLATLATSTSSVPFGGIATTPLAPVGGTGTTTSCYGLTFVSDVTIPDNTEMDPGEAFTKTWKVQNSGSCAWEAGFKFQSTGGAALGSAVTLPSAVAAGATYDISVPMTAPTTAGTARGNWRMSNATGQFFGDEVFVVIVVGGAAPTAPTNTSAPAAATATSTTPQP